MGHCSPGLVEQMGSSYRGGNILTAAFQIGPTRKQSLGFQCGKLTELNGHCEMFCFTMLK